MPDTDRDGVGRTECRIDFPLDSIVPDRSRRHVDMQGAALSRRFGSNLNLTVKVTVKRMCTLRKSSIHAGFKAEETIEWE